MKDSKYYKKHMSKSTIKDSAWLSKLLLSIIVVLVSLIVCNFNSDLRDTLLEDSMKFNEFNKFYNKFMIDNEESKLVSNTIIDDDTFEEVDGRYKFNYGIDYQVEVLKPGIIVFVGEKDDLGNTIIVQGNDGIDIWYSNVLLKEYSLYDYVSNGDILGISNDIYVTISIYKDGELLDYEEYI